jgi:FkbM family methyltransferase
MARVKLSETWRLFRRFVRHVPLIGIKTAALLFFCEASTRSPIAEIVEPFVASEVKGRPSGYAHKIRFRRAGSDVAVVTQVFVTREYGPVASLNKVGLIVDCGANIGLSSYYFLHRYPAARLIAVEPDPDNCELCRKNLAPFGDRAVVLQAAVWPENRPLRITPASRHGGAWSLEVEPWPEGDVEGLTIPEILRRAGTSARIDLLKMDIEGAEADVFRESPAWLQTTRNIAIELHGERAEAAFATALAGYRFERRRADELTIVYGLKPAV